MGPWIPAAVRADPQRLAAWLKEANHMSEAAAGALGGRVTLARYGVEHYRRMERARKTRRGGRHQATEAEIARRVAARRFWIARGKEREG